MSDAFNIRARMRLANYSKSVERKVRQANARAGMELRDIVKQSLNVPGFQIRQKGEIGDRGFVIRKAERINARDASGRFLKAGGPSEARRRSARGIEFKKNEINYDVVRSRPGEPPRRQRGTLYQSQTYELRDSFRGSTVRVGPSVRVAKSARALELGYEPGGLKPRPYLAPAANQYAPVYPRLIAEAVRTAKP